MRDSSMGNDNKQMVDLHTPAPDPYTNIRNRLIPDEPHQQQQRNQQQQQQNHLSRARELCSIAPSSVAPNNTYIRRLEHKGLLPSLESNGNNNNKAHFTLPALSSKDQTNKNLNSKRTKLDPLSTSQLV